MFKTILLIILIILANIVSYLSGFKDGILALQDKMLEDLKDLENKSPEEQKQEENKNGD